MRRLRLFDKQHVLRSVDSMIAQMGAHDIHVTDVRTLKREGGAYVDITTDKHMVGEASAKIVDHLSTTRYTRGPRGKVPPWPSDLIAGARLELTMLAVEVMWG